MSGVTGAAVAASAAVSVGTGIAGAVGGGPDQAAPGQYIPPSVTAKEANAQNAKVLAAINRSIRNNNKYQRKLERQRHQQAREDISWFRDQRESAVEKADPYVNERRKYIAKMAALMEDPTSFLEKSPEYRARMAGGLEALTSQLAAKGLLGSGNVAIEAQALGAREASTQLGKDFERLAKLSGAMDANLGAAADIEAGARIPFIPGYTPQFEGERFQPASYEDSGRSRQLDPGAQLPDAQRQGFGDIAWGLGSLAGLSYLQDLRQDPNYTPGGRTPSGGRYAPQWYLDAHGLSR